MFGGFASTVCWPLSAFLAGHLGWRDTCLTYAAILIAHSVALVPSRPPPEQEHPPQAPATAASPRPGHVRPDQRAAFILLAASFTPAYGIMTVIAVDLLTLFQSRGLALAAAVGLGALVGPS